MNVTRLDLPELSFNIKNHIKQLVSEYKPDVNADVHMSADSNIIEEVSNILINEEDTLGIPFAKSKNFFAKMADFEFLETDKIIKKWIIDNIPFEVPYSSIQLIRNGIYVAPHVDEIRTHAILYMINTGGDPDTCYYKVRDEFKNKLIEPQTCIPYEKLELEETHKLHKDNWYQLNVSNIHSVENITSTRIALSLSLIQ